MVMPSPGPLGGCDMAVLHNEIGLRHQRIGPDDAETEDEFPRRHDVLGRTAGIEVRAGRSFELGQHGKPSAIDLELAASAIAAILRAGVMPPCL